MDLDLYNDTYDLFCEQIISKKPKILEIACGPGNITKYLLSKRSDFKVKGIDIAPNMIQLAKANNPTANFEVMDCRMIDRIQTRFDAIICGFCMPYLSKSDCQKLISDCANLLNQNGIFYFSTIEGDEQQSGFEVGSTGDKCYVYYHQTDDLLNCLTRNQFELTQLIRKNYGIKNGEPQIHLIFLAKKLC